MAVAKKRKRKAACACQAPLDQEGRCTATPSCSDFKKPHQTGILRDAAARRRERDSDYVGVYRGRSTATGGGR